MCQMLFHSHIPLQTCTTALIRQCPLWKGTLLNVTTACHHTSNTAIDVRSASATASSDVSQLHAKGGSKLGPMVRPKHLRQYRVQLGRLQRDGLLQIDPGCLVVVIQPGRRESR